MGVPIAVVPGRKSATVAVAFALVFPSLMTWLYFVVLATPTTSEAGNAAMQAVYKGGKVLQFAFPLLAVVVLERRWPRPLRPTTRGLAFGIGFAALVAAAAFGLYFGLLQHSAAFTRASAMLRGKLS